jgi:hypothetical protein
VRQFPNRDAYYLWLKCPEIEDDGDEDVLISLKLKALFSLVVID